MERSRVSAAHRVRRVGHRIPERQREKLRGDRTDRSETAVALDWKSVSQRHGNSPIRSNCRGQRDLNSLQIAAWLRRRPETRSCSANSHRFHARLGIKTKCKRSTWPSADVRRVDGCDAIEQTFSLLHARVDIKRIDLPDNGRWCLRACLRPKTQDKRE